PDRDAAGSHGSGVAAKVLVGTTDPLHGKAERVARRLGADVDAFEILEQARPAIPGGLAGSLDDVVAMPRRYRNGQDGSETEIGAEAEIVRHDPIEALFTIIDEVDLVHREYHMANAQERAEQRMTPGLHHDALAGVDQEDGELCGRGAGRHVAGILLVTGRVG